MTGVLKQIRSELAGQLTDLTAYDHVPAKALLPSGFVLPGSPYVQAGETFGERLVTLGVVLVTSPSLNSIETDALDLMIERAWTDLEAAGWQVVGVDQPTSQDLNGVEVFATEITVTASVTFD